jgi:hypothetical protein
VADAEQTYDDDRADGLAELLRQLALRIQNLDAQGRLLADAPGLMDLLGRVRSELFHFEVRCTYDTPEIAEHRRIVADATEPAEIDPPEEDEPWRASPGS